MKRVIVSSISYDDVPEENKHGNCYETALKTQMSHPGSILVHGVVTGQGPLEGLQYTHAWVEDGDTVLDNTVKPGFTMNKDDYYALGQIELVRKYTQRQAMEEALRTEVYGPWDDVFNDYH